VLRNRFLALLSLWRPVFRPERSFRRALRPALGSLTVMGTATLTRLLAGLGLDQQDGSAEYRLQAGSEWDEQALLDTLLPTALAHCGGRFIPVALDDTRLQKTGQRIPTAFYQRDPLSPPFHVKLQWGLRFLQASVLLPLPRQHKVNARAVPVRFLAAPSLKKPGTRADPQTQQRYREQRKQQNLSQPASRALVDGLASQSGASRSTDQSAAHCRRWQLLPPHIVPHAAGPHRTALPHAGRCAAVRSGSARLAPDIGAGKTHARAGPAGRGGSLAERPAVAGRQTPEIAL
jgi:hypothetical protein